MYYTSATGSSLPEHEFLRAMRPPSHARDVMSAVFRRLRARAFLARNKRTLMAGRAAANA